MTKTFQKLHPTHLKQLREAVGRDGRPAVERAMGLKNGGLKHAILGKGVWPKTLSAIVTHLAASSAPPPPVRSKAAAPIPFRVTAPSNLKDLGAAASLVLEALSTVEPANRARVLDMARAAL
jgi:hypothetical protein